ncbi:MAG: glycosyltransferase family 9 protein [Armatimonadota bacterium]|nr:glycosyltransferase family 9 protein [Armatimonadota bacterium]
MKRVLIVKLWALGDILMATPMIAALRARFPDVEITWMADSFHAEILAGHPGIDTLIPLDSGVWRRLLRKGNLPGWIACTRQVRSDLAAHNFDAVINCQPDKWWSLFLCAAPVKIGLYPSPRLPVSKMFYTHAIARPANVGLHNTDHYLLATQALGCPAADKRMTIGETPDEAPFVHDFFEAQGLTRDKPIVVLAPFSTQDSKDWDPARYACLADFLHQNGSQLLMTIGPKDSEKARFLVAQASAPIPIAQGTTLRQYVGLIRAADLVVSGDSSPMHIAAAVGTPYVSLFGPTPVDELAPLVGQGIVLHSGPSVNSISVEDAQAAALSLLLPGRKAQHV